MTDGEKNRSFSQKFCSESKNVQTHKKRARFSDDESLHTRFCFGSQIRNFPLFSSSSSSLLCYCCCCCGWWWFIYSGKKLKITKNSDRSEWNTIENAIEPVVVGMVFLLFLLSFVEWFLLYVYLDYTLPNQRNKYNARINKSVNQK